MLAVCPQPRRQEPRLRPRPPRNPWPAVLFLVLAVELCLLPLRRPRQVVEAPVVEGSVLVTTDMGERPVRRIIPPSGKGDSSWMRAPCELPYTEVNGYCFAELSPEKFKPPCPGGLYEHQRKCFAPVVKGQRPPTSMFR